jgi:hypothetical protein
MKTSGKGLYLGNARLPTEHYEVKEWTPKMFTSLKKCSTDIVYFAEKHFTIVDPDKGKTKIKLFAYQKRILRALRDNRFNIMLASRQCGKTTIMTIYALWLCCFQKDKRVLIVANKEDTAIGIFRRIRMAYELLPNWLKTGVKEWGKTGAIFSNDSAIHVSTTSEDAGRSGSYNCLIIDEMAFIDAHIVDPFWNAVFPVISRSNKSKCVIASTPNGVGNLFHSLWSQAQTEESPWNPERVDWWEMPGRDEDWKRETIAAMGSLEAFDQEFGNTFLQSGDAMLNPELLRKFAIDLMLPKFKYEDDCYSIWNEPKEGRLYAAGVDVAEGVGQDASCIQIIDITNLTNIKQSAIYHSNTIDPYNFSSKCHEILQQWGSPPVLVERNNCGAQVVDKLVLDMMYPRIVDYQPSAKGKNFNNRRGIINHTNSKYKGVVNMRYWLNKMLAIDIYDEDTQKELQSFVKHKNGRWAARNGTGVHDDRVMAMLWALFILETEVTKKWFEIAEFDENDKPLRLEPLDWGVGDFMKPSQLYDAKNPREDAYAPVLLGRDSHYMDQDIDDLRSQGWVEASSMPWYSDQTFGNGQMTMWQ